MQREPRLDESLIRQLAPAATVHAYTFEKEVTDDAVLAAACCPCPTPGSAGSSSAQVKTFGQHLFLSGSLPVPEPGSTGLSSAQGECL
jgi:hypothetical protein